jgi:hypothetical protein
MDTMLKRKCILHSGFKKFAETEKGATDQVERESYVDGFFYIDAVTHHEFLCQGQTVNR